MNSQLTITTSSARAVILPDRLDHKLRTADNGARRAVASRLSLFADWLDSTGRAWFTPDLVQYRDYLMGAARQRKNDDGEWMPAPPLSARTVNAHLSTIRSRYDDLLHDNGVIATLDEQAAQQCLKNGWEVNPANIAAMVERVKATIQNDINSKRTVAKVVVKQDRAASEFTRLTTAQANALIAAPGTDDLTALRDTALIALALATGARAAELAALEVGDHKARTEDGALALLIRDGKGGKQRLVPYGALDFAVVVVDNWLKHAGITAGPIFRGFWRGGRRVRQTVLSVVAIENILAKYPVVIDGESRVIKPHDLRRTYARLAWESGMQPVAIQQNLGHASLDTTLIYIGDLDTAHRQPGAFLAFNLGALPVDPLV